MDAGSRLSACLTPRERLISRWVLKRGAFIGGVAALALTLAPTALAAPPGGKPSVSIKRFVVHGVYTREQRSMLVAEGYDIGEAYWADHVELFGTAQQARGLLFRGFRVTSKPLPPRGGPSIPDDFPPGFEDYHDYAEMTAALQAIAASYPQLVHIITLGNWYENRNIIGVRISNDANDNLSEPGVFFVGQHHAREHMTVEVTLGLSNTSSCRRRSASARSSTRARSTSSRA